MDKNFLKTILDRLSKKGCHEADVFFSNIKTSSCSSRLGKIEKKEESSTSEIGIRAIINKRQSIVSTTNLEKQNIYNLTEKVVDMAKVVPENQYCGLAESDQIKGVSKEEVEKLNLCDPYEPSMSLLKEDFPNVSASTWSIFQAWATLLREWNSKINLISRKDIDHL